MRDAAEQHARELKVKQDKVDELQRALNALRGEREDLKRLIESKEQVVQSQASQISQLTAAKDKLQEQNTQLEAAIQDVDTKKQMDLMRTQYEQVRMGCRGGVPAASWCCQQVQPTGHCCHAQQATCLPTASSLDVVRPLAVAVTHAVHPMLLATGLPPPIHHRPTTTNADPQVPEPEGKVFGGGA